MDDYTIVKYHFETDKGPGHVTLAVSDASAIEHTGDSILESFKDFYQEIKLVSYEIIQKQ